MKRISLTLVLTVLTIIFLQNPAISQCRVKASCYAENDYGPATLCSDSPFTRCDSYAEWYVQFGRTLETQNNAGIQFSLTGDYFLERYWAYDHAAGETYNYSGVEYAGPENIHTLFIKRLNEYTGYFREMKVNVRFVADEPTK